MEDVEGHQRLILLLGCYLRVFRPRAAVRRASASAPRTAPRSLGSKLSMRSRVCPTILGIARNGIFPLRKASTATSLAALYTAGATPPAAMAWRAYRIMG